LNNRRKFLATGSFSLAALASVCAWGQSVNSTRIVVGFAPGGSTDTMARLLATQLQKSGGVYIVDNKAGAAGRIGVADVKNGSADGKTILLTPDPMMTVYPLVYKKLNYDPIADFRPITTIATVPMGVAVGPMVPDSVKTLADFAIWLKANPDKASYGSAGAGTTLHFIGVMFGKANGISFNHVPYRGGAPAAVDVMGGQIASSINVISELLPLAQGGKLRILAVSSAVRSRFIPNVPTFREAGYKDLESISWFGVFVPAKTSDATVKQLHSAIVEATKAPEVRDGLEKLGYEVSTLTPDRFDALLKSDLNRWIPMVTASGYTAEE
jgi:tripartite-type tricarboxylate transporter receptor subunit TctC